LLRPAPKVIHQSSRSKEKVDRSTDSIRSLLVFQVSGLNCAFPLEAVREIVPMALLFRPPGLSTVLAGFLDLRGTAVPVLRLDRLFDLPEQSPGMYTPIVILRGGDRPTGVLVGAVRQIVSPQAASFLPLPEKHIFRECATATVEVNGNITHLLTPERILLENERRLMAEFRVMAQERLRRLEERQ
jgi:purine-binding chemotaxis protein CheW